MRSFASCRCVSQRFAHTTHQSGTKRRQIFSLFLRKYPQGRYGIEYQMEGRSESRANVRVARLQSNLVTGKQCKKRRIFIAFNLDLPSSSGIPNSDHPPNFLFPSPNNAISISHQTQNDKWREQISVAGGPLALVPESRDGGKQQTYKFCFLIEI